MLDKIKDCVRIYALSVPRMSLVLFFNDIGKDDYRPNTRYQISIHTNF
jgi:hypothetical protein